MVSSIFVLLLTHWLQCPDHCLSVSFVQLNVAKDPLPWLATNVRDLLSRIAILEEALRCTKSEFAFNPGAPVFVPARPRRQSLCPCRTFTSAGPLTQLHFTMAKLLPQQRFYPGKAFDPTNHGSWQSCDPAWRRVCLSTAFTTTELLP